LGLFIYDIYVYYGILFQNTMSSDFLLLFSSYEIYLSFSFSKNMTLHTLPPDNGENKQEKP